MKNVILCDIYLPLGASLDLIDYEEEMKYIYIIPSVALIQPIKDLMVKQHKNLIGKIDIMTFDQMMRRVIVNDRRIMSPQEQELVVKRAIEKVNSEKKLLYFKNGIDKIGWIKQIEVWIGEIKRAGITSEQLKQFWSNHSNKYQELSLIYEAYQSILKKYSLHDHEEPYFSFLNNNEKRYLVEYKAIVTEQFNDFSPLQMKVLNHLGGFGIDINITLALDNKRKELFQWSYNTLDYFTNLGFAIQEQHFETFEGLKKPFKHLNENLFSLFPKQEETQGSIEIFSVTGKRQEIEMVSAEIKTLVNEKNLNLADIAIITPELEKYKNIIIRIMDKSGIPIRIKKVDKLINNPFIQSLISLLKVFNGDKNQWLSLIYSPYFQFNEKIDKSKLMLIIRELSFPSSEASWNEKFNLYLNKHQDKKEELKKYDNVMKQIFSLFFAKPTKGKNENFVYYIERIEKELKLKEVIKNYFLSNPEKENAFRDIKAYEHWEELKKELLEIDKFLDHDEYISFGNWFTSLILAFEKTEYNYSQGNSDGIHLLSPNQIRGRNFKAVFILGLIEGQFPRPIKNDWLMPDNERYYLRKQGIHLNSSSDYENQQKYHFFQSVISAKEKLYLVYAAKTEDGKEQLRSLFIDELLDLFVTDSVNRRVMDISDIVPKEWNYCVYDAQLINKVYHSLYNPMAESDKDKLAFYINLINRKYPNRVSIINQGIFSEKDRNDKLLSNYDGVLISHNHEIEEFINNKIWSTTQLNLANSCRFSYFAQEILKLSKWEDFEESINPIEKGDLLHRILLRFFNDFRKETNNYFDPQKEEYYLQIINDIAEQEWNLFINQELRYFDQVLSELDWQKLKRDLKQIINHEIYWRKSAESYFYPNLLEFSFGMQIDPNLLSKKEIDPYSLQEKAEINLNIQSLYLRGKIDRVDINDNGQFIIYDYKTGIAPENKDIIEGINLQLPIYLLVLESLLKLNLDQAIGVAFYTKGNKNEKGEYTDNRNRGIWKSEYLVATGLSNRIGSKISQEEWENWIKAIRNRIENLLIKLKKGDYSVLPTTDCPSYCSYKQICRKDDERIREKKSKRGEM